MYREVNNTRDSKIIFSTNVPWQHSAGSANSRPPDPAEQPLALLNLEQHWVPCAMAVGWVDGQGSRGSPVYEKVLKNAHNSPRVFLHLILLGLRIRDRQVLPTPEKGQAMPRNFQTSHC